MAGTLDTAALVAEFGEGLPRLPGGRVDYSRARRVPLMVCFVECQGKLLLLKRSSKVRSYQGKWCAVAGYIDRPQPLEELVCAELRAELGLAPEQVAGLAVGEAYEYTDRLLDRTFRIHPVMVRLRGRPRIEIDWEHTDFEWVAPEAVGGYDTVPMLEESMRRAIRAALA